MFSRLTQALGIDFVKAVAVAAAAEGTDPAHPAIHSPAEADKQPAHHGPRVPQPIKVDTRDLRQVTAAVVPATATWVLEVCSSLIGTVLPTANCDITSANDICRFSSCGAVRKLVVGHSAGG